MATTGQIDPVKKTGTDNKNLPIVYGFDFSESNRGDVIQSIHTNRGPVVNAEGVTTFEMIPSNEGNFITLKNPVKLPHSRGLFPRIAKKEGGGYDIGDEWGLDGANITHIKQGADGTIQSLIFKTDNNEMIEIGKNGNGEPIGRRVIKENGVFVSKPGLPIKYNNSTSYKNSSERIRLQKL
jgi:hypothetical protein